EPACPGCRRPAIPCPGGPCRAARRRGGVRPPTPASCTCVPPALARLPGGPVRAVLEGDPLLAEASADGVGLLEVAALASSVALGDGGLDLRLAEPRALAAARAQIGEQRRGLRGHEPGRGAGASQLGADGPGVFTVAGVESAVQVTDAVEDQTGRLGGVEIVVHRLAERGLERSRLACQRGVDG